MAEPQLDDLAAAIGTSKLDALVVRAPETVHRLFDMIGLTDRLTVVDDPAAA